MSHSQRAKRCIHPLALCDWLIHPLALCDWLIHPLALCDWLSTRHKELKGVSTTHKVCLMMKKLLVIMFDSFIFVDRFMS